MLSNNLIYIYIQTRTYHRVKPVDENSREARRELESTICLSCKTKKLPRDRQREGEKENADEKKEKHGWMEVVLETAANSARNLPKCLPVGRVTSCSNQ